MNKQFLILTLMCAALLACTANHENLDAMTALHHVSGERWNAPSTSSTVTGSHVSDKTILISLKMISSSASSLVCN